MDISLKGIDYFIKQVQAQGRDVVLCESIEPRVAASSNGPCEDDVLRLAYIKKDWDGGVFLHIPEAHFDVDYSLKSMVATLSENLEDKEREIGALLPTKVVAKQQAERIAELEKSQERMVAFIKGHIEKWDYCRELQPSLQVLKRCLPNKDRRSE